MVSLKQLLVITGVSLCMLIPGYRNHIHATAAKMATVQPQHVDPRQVIIAFDLHNVLFTLSITGIVKQFWHTSGKLRLIKQVGSPFFWRDILRIKKQQNIHLEEELFMRLSEQRPQLKPYQSTFVKFSNQQVLNQEVFTIAHQLKQQGYRLVVASNIGEATYTDLIKKYPQVGELFEFVFIPSHVHYIKKPHKEYFTEFRQQIRQRFPETQKIVFIDDNPKNVASAERQAIISIHFTDPAALRISLNQMLATELPS